MTTLVWLFLSMSVIITAAVTSKYKDWKFNSKVKQYNKTHGTTIKL